MSDRGADTGDPGPPGPVKLEWLMSHLLCCELSVSWALWALSTLAGAVPCARKGGWLVVEAGVEWGGGRSADCVQTLTPFTSHEALCNSLQLIWNKGEFP